MRRSTLAIALLISACPAQQPEQTDAGVAPAVDAGPPAPTFCELAELPSRPFDATGPSAMQRRQPAGDFTVPLSFGETFTLSERWTGCESYIFLPHNLPISQADPTSVLSTNLVELLNNSPRNVHYFFLSAGSGASATAAMRSIKGSIEAALDPMSDEDYDHWQSHLHAVSGDALAIDGLVGSMLASAVGRGGFAIDRFQKLRGIGSLADVRAFNRQLQQQGGWPYEARLYSAGWEAQYFNFEAERHQRMAAETVTEIAVFDGSVVEQFTEGIAEFPDAATMAGFDTMEFDVLMECPDRDRAEQGNCGAWDYLGHVWLRDEEGERWLEMGRIITTYHRESQWVMDASWALAWLQQGGSRQIKFEWAPEWNKQPTGVTLTIRLSNRGKGYAARGLTELFTGGRLNTDYNTREPVSFTPPQGTLRTELVVVTSGHGMDSGNCAEFCAHSHHFSVAGTTFDQAFPAVGDQQGCAKTSGEGTVPNQSGTWWFGRGGWCPGRDVVPFVQDLTELAPAGAEASISYEAKINGRAPFDNAGNIHLRAYAVYYH